MNNQAQDQDYIGEPKINIWGDFVAEHEQLFCFFKDHINWDNRIKARKTASFGIAYNYSGIDYPAIVMLPELMSICQKIEQKIGFLPNNCLMNYYETGYSSMGYHYDSIENLVENTGVVIISLGATRHISFRSQLNPEIKYKYPLSSGSCLYMDQEIQKQWMHGIRQEKKASSRISLTFRQIKTP